MSYTSRPHHKLWNPHTEWTLSISGLKFRIGGDIGVNVNLLDIALEDEDVLGVVKNVREHYTNIMAYIQLYDMAKNQDEITQFGDPTRTHKQEWAIYSSAILKPYTELLALAECQPYMEVNDEMRELAAYFDQFYRDALGREELRYFHMIKRSYPNANHGHIYLFKMVETGYFKIGLSINPQRRSKEIPSGLPLTIETIHTFPTNQMDCAENELHKKFSSKRMGKTEWFQLDEDDVEYIKSIHERMFPWLGRTSDDPAPDFPDIPSPFNSMPFGQKRPTSKR
jgi:hypothetical protein